MKVDWLNRSFIVGPFLCLALSDEAFQEAFDDLDQEKEGRPPWVLNSHSNATCHTLQNKKGDLCAVLCFRSWEGHTGIEIAGLLLHEAVHIWQRYCQHIGEDDPSLEFEAYSIQHIAQQLMWSFQEQTA
jgi:hypothetical protein